MKKNLLVLLSAVSSMIIYSCSTSSPEDFFEEIPDSEIQLVTFNEDVQPILNSSCVECHGGPFPAEALSLETFEDAVNGVQNRNVLSRIIDVDNPMPPSGLLPSQVTDIIFQWVEDGLLEEE